MCNFVPGEVIALGPLGALHELPRNLPGQLQPPSPLVTEVGTLGDSPLLGVGSVVLRTDPGGELFALAQLSAALSDLLQDRKAVVDLNHYIPASAEGDPGRDPANLRFSPRADEVIARLRSSIRNAFAAFSRVASFNASCRIAVLDSGLDERLRLHRDYEFFDYASNGRLTPNAAPSDPRGHGTKVIKILDSILPPDVPFVVGRLPAREVELTSLILAHALGDLAARTNPAVINLSLGTSDHVALCPSCRKRVPLPGFFSSILPMVVRLCGKSQARTVAVIAAGNHGKTANTRWIHADLENLVFAVAENRRGETAKYSAAVEGPTADLCSASAFGGDDTSDAEPMGVFSDGTHGTSFAAPFVAAAALIARQLPPSMMSPPGIPDIGLRVRAILNGALSFTTPPNQTATAPE